MDKIAGFYKEGQAHLGIDQRFVQLGNEIPHTLQKEDCKASTSYSYPKLRKPKGAYAMEAA